MKKKKTPKAQKKKTTKAPRKKTAKAPKKRTVKASKKKSNKKGTVSKPSFAGPHEVTFNGKRVKSEISWIE